MAKRIQGITIELDGETKGLDKALQGVNKQSRDLQGELRDVEKLLKFNPGNTELLAQKQKLLGDQVETTRNKLNQLKDAEAEVQRQFENGDIKEEQYRAFQREIVETESKLKHFESQVETSKSSLEKLADKAATTGESFKKSGEKMKNAGSTMTKNVTLPIVGAAAALGVFISKTINAGDEAAKNARKVGVSTEAYQEYQYALGQTGLSAEDTDKALGRLNTRIGEARDGSDKYSEALEKAGVDMKALADGTLTTDEAMMQAVEGLSKITNEQDRAAAATELFGTKLGRELMPALEGGVEGLEAARQKARDLGIVMSDEAAVKAEEFNDSMEDLQAGVKGAFREFATNLIPVLTDQLLPALQEHLIPAVQKFSEKIQALIEWFMDLSPKMQKAILIIIAIVAAIGPVLFVFGQMAVAIGALMSLFSALAPIIAFAGGAIGAISAPVLIAIAAIAALIAIGVLLWKNWDTIVVKAKEFGMKMAAKFQEIKTAVGDKMAETKEKIAEIWGQVERFFTNIDLRQIGRNIIWGLIGGIGSMARAVVNSVKDVVGGAITGAKRLLGIASPSKVFTKMGEQTGEGLEDGMKAMGRRVSKAGEKMVAMSIPKQTGTSQAESGSFKTESPQPIIIQSILNGRVIAEETFSDIGQLMGGRTNLNYSMKGA